MANECPIWGTNAVLIDKSDSLIVDSVRAGGLYEITKTALAMIGEPVPKRCAAITNWLVDRRQQGISIPVLHSDSLAVASNRGPRSVSERVERLVLWLAKNLGGLGRNLPLGLEVNGYTDAVSLYKMTYELAANIGSEGHHETMEVLDFAIKLGLVEASQYKKFSGGFFSLTFEGHKEVERLQTVIGQSEQAFVAMWFGSHMNDAYEKGFLPAIEDTGYRAMRIDRKEHNNKIDDEIIAEIRRSKFLIADFTSDLVTQVELPRLSTDEAIARGGVYFEAGFAKGLGKEVIWTVRSDLIELVHFDTRQFAHIVWRDHEDLRKKLAARISATMGDGPLKAKH